MRLLLVAVLALVLAAPASAQVSFDTTEHDFGEIVEGASPQYTFVFRNDGMLPLKLRSVRPSCGCTTPSFTQDEIPSGGTGEIVVEYASQGRPGPFRKSIRVTAEQGDATLDETLYIVGHVERAAIAEGVAQGNLLFDTDAFDFGTVSAAGQATHVFKVQHGGGRPIRISEAKSVPEGLHIVAPSTPVFADDVVSLRVTVPANAAAGAFDYAIVLTTDDEAQPVKSLRLTGVMQ